ncbi:MAG: C40 family peptidase [Burkholderiales bacterium]|nr:C40 family peptidase [Burkholderiales bacterium]
MTPSKAIINAVRVHAQLEYPNECCGVIVAERGRMRYVPCANLAAGADSQFVLDPVGLALAERRGTVVAIVHSHPNAKPDPSTADRIGCERSGLPWLIFSWPLNTWRVIEPEHVDLPLLGREFVHGVVDCYTLIRDYYRIELGIEIPDFERRDDWWKPGKGGEAPQDLYRQHFDVAGFVQVGDLRQHDVIFVYLQSDRANHGAIYLGDNLLLHHVWGRLSCRDVWGGYWAKHHAMTVRHRALC